MYEVKENSRILKDGTEITTYSRDVVSCNILEVEAGTTGYCGGDTGHGGRTYFRIQDAACTDMEIHSYTTRCGSNGFEVCLGGDVGVVVRAVRDFGAEGIDDRAFVLENRAEKPGAAGIGPEALEKIAAVILRAEDDQLGLAFYILAAQLLEV